MERGVQLDYREVAELLKRRHGKTCLNYTITAPQSVPPKFASLLPKARFAPVIPGWEDIAQTTSNAIQKIYLGQGEIEPTLKEAAAKVNATLSKN